VTHQSLDSHHTALISNRKYRSCPCFGPVSLLNERQTPPSGTRLGSLFLILRIMTEIEMVCQGVLSVFLFLFFC